MKLTLLVMCLPTPRSRAPHQLPAQSEKHQPATKSRGRHTHLRREALRQLQLLLERGFELHKLVSKPVHFCIERFPQVSNFLWRFQQASLLTV
jgi:hypothetical protein